MFMYAVKKPAAAALGWAKSSPAGSRAPCS